MPRIDGAKVLVTGANRGIGLAFVEAALEHGATKIYAGTRDPAALGDLKDRFGAKVQWLPLDLADSASIDAMAAAAGDVDLFISNAGQTLIEPLLDSSEADWRMVMEVNFFGPMRLARALAPGLRERKGGIIYLLSMAAWLPATGAEIYSASKAACAMGAQGMRSALKADGVAVSMVYPGFVDTRMGEVFPVKKASPQQIAARAIDGWLAGKTAIFPDLFARMTETALIEKMPAILEDPETVLAKMVEEFIGHAEAGS